MEWSLHQILKMELAKSMGLEGWAYQCRLPMSQLRLECIPGDVSPSLRHPDIENWCPANWDHHGTKENLPWLVGILAEFEEQNFHVWDRFRYALH